MKIQLIFYFLTLIIAPSFQYRVTKVGPKQQDEVAQSDINKAPWLASLRIHGIHYCSGAIISYNTIVTVKYCMIDKSMYDTGIMKRIVTVKVGSSNLYDNSSIYTINKCGIEGPPLIDDISTWDLSMIRINGRFNFDGPGAPKAIELHYPRPLPVDIEGNVTSWGYDVSSRKGAANLTIKKWSMIDESQCCPYFNSTAEYGNHFCAFSSEGKVKNPCTIGDIGDPLVVDGKLVGLKSFKNDCRLFPHSPTVFVTVKSVTLEYF